ncbi:Transposase [Cordylochernes scorpioides]|uniref:Transposase n=1 Tax=Cordylochernes scorpioides TaxID=51811 RepID=A0ABY6L5T6_9ARAC|nr:Transposase [Cordylochernes scorpioides]
MRKDLETVEICAAWSIGVPSLCFLPDLETVEICAAWKARSVLGLTAALVAAVLVPPCLRGFMKDAELSSVNHQLSPGPGATNAGATRVTSARVDRRILRQAVAAPQATCTTILQHVQDTLDHSISTKTISRRLISSSPLQNVWADELFFQEMLMIRPHPQQHPNRVRVWRRRGERSNPATIVERPTVRQRGIMVWGAIAYDSRSPLLRIQGTMTAQRYIDDVLRPVTLPYLQGVPNALYQQDNARPHTARISQQAMQDVQMLPWSPYSPDLSPIEHVWDIIGRRLHALPQPRSEDELWQMVEKEWRAIPQDAIRTLIDSLPRRVAACIAVRGGPTCY